MAKFFIDRPIFAWVIALFIMVLGGVAITQLPISQYPPVAPPSIVINASYPGASAQTLEDSVLSVIEREMNGSPGLIYMESVAQADGSGSITLSFQPGTNADLAQVDVQNRLSRASPRLPSTVTQQGVRVDKSGSNFLLFTMLSSSNPETDTVALGDYASRNVVPELLRRETLAWSTTLPWGIQQMAGQKRWQDLSACAPDRRTIRRFNWPLQTSGYCAMEPACKACARSSRFLVGQTLEAWQRNSGDKS